MSTINDFIKDPEKNSDECYNFYDWFCREESLKNKAKSFVPKLKFLVKNKVVNENTKVFFKNNCLAGGSLYDDIRFTNTDGRYLGGLCPRNAFGNKENKCNVWFFDFDEKLRIIDFKNYRDFQKEIKSGSVIADEIKRHLFV